MSQTIGPWLGMICLCLLPHHLSGQQTRERGAPFVLLDGVSITERDLNIQEKLRFEQEVYQARLRVLDEVISRRLLEKEAAKRKLTVEQLLEQEVTSKAGNPSPQEQQAFYLQRRTGFQQPLDKVRDQVIRMLKSQKVTEARQAYIGKLRARSSITILLEPPRFRINTANAPRRGPAAAPVTITAFTDFQCPYCKKSQEVLRQVLARYGDKVSLVFKDLPLGDIHPQAQQAAESARCAGEQGKYWDYYDALFAADRLGPESYPAIARSLRLDVSRFQRCLESHTYGPQVGNDASEAEAWGISSTPTFLINGIVVVGAQPLDTFTKIIDAELSPRSKGQAKPPH